ncbi:MAG: glycosyltransferase [Lachnospiraceae bacterium]
MKICLLKESLCIGGTERSAANVSKALHKEHDVYLALYDGRQIEYTYSGCLIDFKLPANNSFLTKIKNNIARIYQYNRLIKEKEIDILFEFISINNPISKLNHKEQIRIISSRDFSVLSNCTTRFNQCLKKADALICNSQFLRDYYVSHYPEHQDRVYTVYNIIDMNEIITQSKENVETAFHAFIHNHKQTIVSVGRFCKEKGFEYLIESFAQARKKDDKLGLVLVGDGDYKQRYLEIIKQFEIEEHVFFTGFQQNPYKYMAKCNCFVLSSLSEGFPNVLAEAMALGLPVIADNCYSGPAEILRNDQDYEAITDRYQECDFGIITPRITEENNDNAIYQLSEAIVALLSDKDKLTRYACKSRQRAGDFSEEATRKQLNLIFNELMERRNKRND